MTISVSQYNNFIKGIIDCEPMLSNVEVKGELSNVNIVRGNVYFVLKDEYSQIDCFAYFNEKDKYSDGDSVVVSGRASYYAVGGRLSFFATKIKKVDSLGTGYAKFLLLKEKLEKEGCFSRPKRKFSKFPKRVGIVTSMSGAVIHDIISVLGRRSRWIDIVLFPVKVQGFKASDEIVEGINFFNNADVDTIILARGGGASEDLEAFNAESVVRAINASIKPIISAVGHQTDFALSDFAADLRASTPSVAAEIASESLSETVAKLNSSLRFLSRCCEGQVNKVQAQIDSKLNKVCNVTQRKLFSQTLVCKQTARTIETLTDTLINERVNYANILLSKIDMLNPIRRLQSGYAYLSKAGNKINANNINVGDSVNARLLDVELTLKVEEVRGI